MPCAHYAIICHNHNNFETILNGIWYPKTTIRSWLYSSTILVVILFCAIVRLNNRLRNNREVGNLSCHRAHYDVIVMYRTQLFECDNCCRSFCQWHRAKCKRNGLYLLGSISYFARQHNTFSVLFSHHRKSGIMICRTANKANRIISNKEAL